MRHAKAQNSQMALWEDEMCIQITMLQGIKYYEEHREKEIKSF